MIRLKSMRIRIIDNEIKIEEQVDKELKAKSPKIYLISKSKKILYVGITKQSIITRLRIGERAYKKPQNGYSGYKWLKENAIYDLSIVLFGDIIEDANLYLETIEAEIAYLVRNIEGQWPGYQNEIHFHESNKAQRDISLEIVNSIINKK